MGVLLVLSTTCKFLSALAGSNFLSLLIAPSTTFVANFLPCLPFLSTPRQWVGEALHSLLINCCPSLIQDDHVPKLGIQSLPGIHKSYVFWSESPPANSAQLPSSVFCGQLYFALFGPATVPLQGVLLWCLPCWHGGWKVCRPSVGKLGKTQR